MQQAISVEQITDKAVLLNSIQRQTVYEFIDFLLNKTRVNGYDRQNTSLDSKLDVREEISPMHILRTAPATCLDPLIGIVAVGGDAFEESEALYDE